MSPGLWVGVGFTAALVFFLMVTYFARDKSTETQKNTLRFLTSLCGGFAGGFFAGEALVSYQKEMSGGATLAISGTAGFAIFFVVWLTYARGISRPPPDGIKLGIPSGWTFQAAARAIVSAARSVVTFDGFSQTQLDTELTEADIDAQTVTEALNQLQYLSSDVPNYRVDRKSGVYHIRATGD